jgi:glycerol transport system ATP-binding protein
MARIDLADLAHSYRPNPEGPKDFALKTVSFSFADGGAYALLGPSGCGKTTLLNLISGLVTPTRGAILFNGVDVSRLATERRNIAQVFQFPVVYDTMSVYDNLAFPLRNRRVAAGEVDARVRGIAQMLDLPRDLGRKARGLTADAKQKISLGRGLVRPDVAAILFDEPLTVIDPHLKWQLRSQLKQLHAQVAMTMIYVTHDQTEALTFAETVIVMYDGAIVQIGTPEELFEEPAHTFVGYFIGSPGMNILPAEVVGATARVGGHAIPLGRAYPKLPAGVRIEIGVRPEHITLSHDARGLPVNVHRVDDIGRLKLARVGLGSFNLNVVMPEDARVDGNAAHATLTPANVHVYADGRLVRGEAA